MKNILSLIFLGVVILAGASIEDLLREGIMLREQGKIDESILKFQEILKSKAKHPQANFEIAKSYLLKNDCENAITYFKNAAKYGYDKFQSSFNLGLAYEACGNNMEASYEFSEALRIKSDDLDCMCALARVSQQNNVAESLYLAILKIDKNNAPAMVGLANLYANRRQKDKALSYYEKATAVKPDYAPGFYALGNFYLQEKLYPKSIVEFTKFIQLEPKKPKGYTARADAYSKMNNDSSAIKDLKIATGLGDTSLGTLKFLGFLLNRAKLMGEYKKVLNQIVAKDPYDIQSWLDIARIANKVDTTKNGWVEAAFAYNKVIGLDTMYIREIASDLGKVYYSIGKYDSAVYWFSRAIMYDTLKVATYFNRALSYIQLKKYRPEAIEDLKKGLRFNPKYVQGWLWLGQIYEFLGMKSEALTAYNKVLGLDPKNKTAREGIQRLKRPAPAQRPSTEDYWDKYWDELYKPK